MIKPETIQKCCFKQSGVHNEDPSPIGDQDSDQDHEFANYFRELLDIPWDQYLAVDQELELEQPDRAPNASACKIEENETNKQADQDQEPPPIAYDTALE